MVRRPPSLMCVVMLGIWHATMYIVVKHMDTANLFITFRSATGEYEMQLSAVTIMVDIERRTIVS